MELYGNDACKWPKLTVIAEMKARSFQFNARKCLTSKSSLQLTQIERDVRSKLHLMIEKRMGKNCYKKWRLEMNRYTNAENSKIFFSPTFDPLDPEDRFSRLTKDNFLMNRSQPRILDFLIVRNWIRELLEAVVGTQCQGRSHKGFLGDVFGRNWLREGMVERWKSRHQTDNFDNKKFDENFNSNGDAKNVTYSNSYFHREINNSMLSFEECRLVFLRRFKWIKDQACEKLGMELEEVCSILYFEGHQMACRTVIRQIRLNEGKSGNQQKSGDNDMSDDSDAGIESDGPVNNFDGSMSMNLNGNMSVNPMMGNTTAMSTCISKVSNFNLPSRNRKPAKKKTRSTKGQSLGVWEYRFDVLCEKTGERRLVDIDSHEGLEILDRISSINLNHADITEDSSYSNSNNQAPGPLKVSLPSIFYYRCEKRLPSFYTLAKFSASKVVQAYLSVFLLLHGGYGGNLALGELCGTKLSNSASTSTVTVRSTNTVSADFSSALQPATRSPNFSFHALGTTRLLRLETYPTLDVLADLRFSQNFCSSRFSDGITSIQDLVDCLIKNYFTIADIDPIAVVKVVDGVINCSSTKFAGGGFERGNQNTSKLLGFDAKIHPRVAYICLDNRRLLAFREFAKFTYQWVAGGKLKSVRAPVKVLSKISPGQWRKITTTNFGESCEVKIYEERFNRGEEWG